MARAEIVALACLEPVAAGLSITHWSSTDLARAAVQRGIVTAISPRTVRRILATVDMHPHRTRYWRTPRLDATFKARAEQVLWCYAHADRLAQHGRWVVCTDEMPNKQVLERTPIRRAIPHAIEQQEFEYVRHGTVTVLTVLLVHSGAMAAYCLDANDAAHYIAALDDFRQQHRDLRGVYLIHDNGASHVAQATTAYFRHGREWWHARQTPAHASWLNQGELLNNAFSERYLTRGSWASREAYIAHVARAWPEYNQHYAHPFEWTWTNHRMRKWFTQHAPA